MSRVRGHAKCAHELLDLTRFDGQFGVVICQSPGSPGGRTQEGPAQDNRNPGRRQLISGEDQASGITVAGDGLGQSM